ncbi:hypothetical protein [Streptomyces sp. cg35]|uniref:hypothetical protein n=1 Tax=Streptomyces sp. cg35 TaxID=3421650 RepID=UPI003D174EF9
MSKPNRKVIRLQQMRMKQAEAAGIKYVDVVYEAPGEAPGTFVEKTCSFLKQDFWPVEIVRSVQDAANTDQFDVLKRVASPPEAFDELVSVAQLTVGELKELVEELSDEADTDEGEGSGSSDSLRSTQEPSAPTSSATTPAAA